MSHPPSGDAAGAATLDCTHRNKVTLSIKTVSTAVEDSVQPGNRLTARRISGDSYQTGRRDNPFDYSRLNRDWRQWESV